jgi:hypothetical protein
MLMRFTGVLGDGTSFELQQEVPLDQFAQQMTAMVDQLSGHGAGGRRVSADPPPAAGPGRWVEVNRNGMSQRARDYQQRATGIPAGYEYELNGRKFDGYEAATDTLIEAKGEGYAYLLDPENTWSTAKNALIKEAVGQLTAAEGRRIVWYVAEEAAVGHIKDLFARSGILGIVVEHKP